MTTDELRALLVEAALSPKAASGDGGSVTARSMDELLKALVYLESRENSRHPHRGLRITQLLSPGPTS